MPTKNKFIGAIQQDTGVYCTNSGATATQLTLKPCTAETDTVANCTSGNIWNFTESTGDRFTGRCLDPSGTTFDYSGFKMYLNDGSAYTVATVPTEAYRGVNILGDNLIVENANGSGTGACGGATNLISNADFETVSTFCARSPTAPNGSCGTTCSGGSAQTHVNADHWPMATDALLITTADCHAGSCVSIPSSGSAGDGRMATLTSTSYSPTGFYGCSSDACGPGLNAAAPAYIQLSKNTTYTLTFWMKLVGTTARDAGLFIRAHTTAQSVHCSPTASLQATSVAGGTTVSPTWVAGNNVVTFFDVPPDGTYRQYTVSFDTNSGLGGVSDPFYSEIEVSTEQGIGSGGTFYFDDFAWCHPGSSVDATALTTRALTEDQLSYVPKVTRSADTLSLGPFIGADISPKIAPSVVSGGSVTQTSAVAVQAALPYTAPTGTYTLTQASSIVAKKPEVGTQRYSALFNWVTGWDQDADGAGVTCIADDETTDELFADKDCDGTKDAGENYIDSGGTVTGTGTDFFIPRWNGTTALTDSIVHQSNLSAEVFVAGELKPNGSTFSLGGLAAPWLKTWSDELASGDINGDGTYDNLVIATPNATGTDTARMTITGNVNTTSTTTWSNTSILNLGGAAVTNTAAITPQTDNVSALGSQSQRYTTVNASNMDSFGTSLVLKTKNTGAASSDRLTITSGVTNATAAWSNVSKVFPTTDLGTDLGDATHRFGFLYATGIASEATNMTFYTNNNAATETLRATLSQGAATATWTFAATNLAMGSGTITGVGTPISFEAGAIDPSVTAPSSGVIGFDRDTDSNQEITDNSSGISFNPSDDGSSEWSQGTLGQVTHVHTPATTGGVGYQLSPALPTGNYSGAGVIGFGVTPSTASTGPAGACVGGSNPGTACSIQATCTGGGVCQDNSNSGNFNGLNFNTSSMKGIWQTIYPLSVAFNTSSAPWVNEAAASYYQISLTDSSKTDRVGGTSILFDDALAGAAITTNLVYGVNVGAGSWGYGVGSSPVVGLRVEDNSAASTNVKDVAGSHGISLLNDKYYSWGAALDTAQSSRSGGIRMNGTSTMDLEIGTTVRGQVTSTGLKSNGQGVASGTGSNSHGVVLFGVKTATDAAFDTGTEVCGGNSPALTCVGTSDVLGTNIACGTAHTTIDNWLAFCK